MLYVEATRRDPRYAEAWSGLAEQAADEEKWDVCLAYARQVNPKLQVLQVSATRGEGLPEWYGWLRSALGLEQHADLLQQGRGQNSPGAHDDSIILDRHPLSLLLNLDVVMTNLLDFGFKQNIDATRLLCGFNPLTIL